jgi:ABC-type transport system substrate-binding protein
MLKEWQANHPDLDLTSSTMVTTTDNSTATSTDILSQAEADVAILLGQELNPAQTFYRQGKADKKTNATGSFFTIKLVTADTAEYHQAAELISGFWQEVGIQTIVEFVSPKDMSREVLKGRNYDVLLYGAIVGSDPDQYPFWHSSQIEFPGLNLAHYTSRAVDRLLEQARSATNPAEQEDAYKKFQNILLSDRPAIFLYSPTYRYATSDRVLGITVDRIFQPADRFANVTQWYVKTTGRWQF